MQSKKPDVRNLCVKALKEKNVSLLKEMLEKFRRRIDHVQCLSKDKIAALATTRREKSAEIYIPRFSENGPLLETIALRSVTDGNCLYSSLSLLLVGDDSLVDEIRLYTSIELFLYSEYYGKHPHFLSSFEIFGSKISSSVDSLLHFSTSFDNDGVGIEGVVKAEAFINLNSTSWSSFLCILASSSVLGFPISFFYPDVGDEKYRLLFNGLVKPRDGYTSPYVRPSLKILFCYSGSSSSDNFVKPNHFVPLVSIKTGSKRKGEVSPVLLNPKKVILESVGSKVGFGNIQGSKTKPLAKVNFNGGSNIPSFLIPAAKITKPVSSKLKSQYLKLTPFSAFSSLQVSAPPVFVANSFQNSCSTVPTSSIAAYSSPISAVSNPKTLELLNQNLSGNGKVSTGSNSDKVLTKKTFSKVNFTKTSNSTLSLSPNSTKLDKISPSSLNIHSQNWKPAPHSVSNKRSSSAIFNTNNSNSTLSRISSSTTRSRSTVQLKKRKVVSHDLKKFFIDSSSHASTLVTTVLTNSHSLPQIDEAVPLSSNNTTLSPSGSLTCNSNISKNEFRDSNNNQVSTSSEGSLSNSVSLAGACSSSVSSPKADQSNLNQHRTHKYDICTYQEKIKSDCGKDPKFLFDLINNVYKPHKSFTFPSRSGRKFLVDWLEAHSWLCYSPKEDGAYCLPCVLFGNQFPSKINRMKNLFSSPLTLWSDATRKFRTHELSDNNLHSFTFPAMADFIKCMKGNGNTIPEIIDKTFSERREANRQILRPIVDTVRLCAQINIAFRGHRDDSKYHPEIGSVGGVGIGNFNSILNYRVRSGDKVLEEHLRNCGKNQSYISKTSQNALIDACGSVVLKRIIDDVREAGFFSIIADEASDCSNKEYLSLVLRFVDTGLEIREDFVGFIECKYGLAGKDLAKLVLEKIDSLGLDIKNCRGQGYDGAGAVAGHKNGLSAHIKKINPLALYTHCHSHRLNLVVSKACEVLLVRHMMDQVSQLTYFFSYSPGRQKLLLEDIKTHCPDLLKHKLKDPSKTRWIERVTGLDTFQDCFVAIFHCLKRMASNSPRITNSETSMKALSHFKHISSFKFLLSLVVVREVFDLTIDVTRHLQDRKIDVVSCKKLINTLTATCQSVRDNIEENHSKWFEQASELANSLEISVEKPRTVERQIYRSNASPSGASVSDYFKVALTIPLLDHLNIELKSRFGEDQFNIFNGMYIVPSELKNCVDKDIDWETPFLDFCAFFAEDLPNSLALKAEMKLWKELWLFKHKGSLPCTIKETLVELKNLKSFDNISAALKLLATFPVTSCECERSFSALRRLKPFTRSTMLDERLNSLALVYIHREIVPPIDEIITKFGEGGNRRLDF